MEFVVNKRDFVKALGRVQSVADKRSPMPILSNVLIRAEASGAVHFAATDLLLSVTGTMRAEVKRAGSVALPARHVFDTVKALPEGEVTLTVEKNHFARIRGAKRRFDLAGMPGEDFPSLPEAGKVPLVAVPAEDLGELIALTAFSMSMYSSACASKPKLRLSFSMTLPTTTDPSTPAFSAIWRSGAWIARRTIMMPAF